MSPPSSFRLCQIRVAIVTLIATFGLAEQVGARPNIRQAFFVEYPAAVGTAIDTVPSTPGHCGVCHYDFNGGGTRNPYGVRLGQVIGGYPNTETGRRQAIRSIQNEDSDADGYSSLTEITDTAGYANTPTFPGLTPGNVGSVSNVNTAEIQAYLVPTSGADTTPPSVTLLVPAGGWTYTANSSVTVEWIATDASGIAAVDLYVSDDAGVIYRPVAMGLANSGTYSWFPANRPTTQAKFMVVATDNALNVGTAESNGYFTIESPPGGIAPTTLRDFDQPGTQPFETSELNDPANCAACHGNYNTAFEPYYNWQGSMMAQASRDILFEACMAVANQDAPDSGDLCLRCHIPAAWTRGRSVPTSGAAVLPSDMHGVSCDGCHRLVDPIYDPANPAEDQDILAALSFPPDGFGNGMFVLDPTGARRGPFVDAALGHPVLVSPFHQEAALCGTCHDVSNPAFEKDGSGNYPPNAFDMGPASFSPHSLMPIERTYSEWFNSAYNTPGGVFAPEFGGNKDYVATCQDCHLRDVTGQGCNVPGAPTRTDLPLHDMTGGSTWLPALLPAMYPGDVNAAAIDAGIARARYMLQNAADIEVEQLGRTLKVTVTNQTGHKLPTGYPEGRRVWINVRWRDEEGALIAESGAYDAATGVLSHDAQAKIYEAEPGLDVDTAALVGVPPGPSFHFVLNNKIYKDNRIPPRGFTNAAFAQFGGAPVGHTYADGQHWDETLYDIPNEAVAVEIVLFYQSTSKEFVEFLRDENTTNTKGQQLFDLWANNDRCPPEVMAQAQLALTPPVPGDADGDGDVDLDDYAGLVECLTGPAVSAQPDCRGFDLDSDMDVDLHDVAAFNLHFTTP